MKVHFYATLRAAVGAKTTELALRDGGSVADLVDEIVAQYPQLRAKLLTADGSLARGVHVFVNGRGAGYLPEGLATPIAPDDRIDVFPAVAGG